MNRWKTWLSIAAILVTAASLASPARFVSAAPAGTRVAMVFDVGGRGDQSFNDMAYVGLSKAAKELGVAIKEFEPNAGGTNREELLRLAAEDGFHLVIGVGFLFTDQVKKVSGEFPKTRFGLVDGFIGDLKDDSNVACLLFKEEEGSFLVGAAAALKSRAKKVGFVGGMKIPLIEKFQAGYIAGVKHIDPKIQVFSDYAGTTGEAFRDPVKGKELALAQYGRGADIVYHASGLTGLGVFEAAAQRQRWAIGVDADQSLTVQKANLRRWILTSMMKRVDVAVFETIRAFAQNKFKGGYRTFGLKEGGVGYAVNAHNKAQMEPIVARLEALKRDIVGGKIKVPTAMKDVK
jgi:basic membrane protein A